MIGIIGRIFIIYKGVKYLVNECNNDRHCNLCFANCDVEIDCLDLPNCANCYFTRYPEEVVK